MTTRGTPVRWSLALLATLTPFGTLNADDPPLAEAFRAEVESITVEPLNGIDDPETWKARRPELQRQLREMLGLEPLPERTSMEVEVRKVVERPDFVVEAILYQSSPGLYVTGNLYRPKDVTEPLPAILYVCGHAGVERDGVIYGCKAHYQHHAAWYAANGYVCFIVDTLQLGEVPGLHHGTYREGRWWWQGRGYTPAGVEVWNGIRAIDYLAERPEVDPDRIGVTGRSGGGAMSWYLGAVDDRLAAVIPVAGITDLRDHVLPRAPDDPHPRGVIEGHCDCMYFVNTYRWDFDTLAALVAPKPLLVENTDADPIFPLDGVHRIYDRLETVYEWYDAEDRLGLVIGEGGHVDSEEIRHPSFAFMNTWLKGEPTDPTEIEEPDRAVPIEDLKVLGLGEHPSDARNDSIDASFVPQAKAPPVPDSAEAWAMLRTEWLDALRDEVFDGWPDDPDAPMAVEVATLRDDSGGGPRLVAIDFESQPGVRLRAYLLIPTDASEGSPASAVVVDAEAWGVIAPWIDDPSSSPPESVAGVPIAGADGPVALLIPRGVGPTAWEDGSVDTHLRRRFALLGQTLDGMRVWDIRRALRSLDGVDGWPGLDGEGPIELAGSDDAASQALWAAVFEPGIDRVRLADLPASVDEGPAYLNMARVLDWPRAVALLHPRPVTLANDSEAFAWTFALGRALGAPDWPERP